MVLILAMVALVGCASNDDGAGRDSAPVVDRPPVDQSWVEARADSPPPSPWLGCHNSGGERTDTGCYFQWNCPSSVDRKVTCQPAPAGTGFVCVCNDLGGAETGHFDDAEACGRTAQEIAQRANGSCGWELPDET